MASAFLPFDPSVDLDITSHDLPHWSQTGTACFITFRTADSLPRAVVARLRSDRDDLLSRHGIDPNDLEWRSRVDELPPSLRLEFRRLIGARFHELLDNCHGECLLKRPDLASVVAETLRHFDGVRYRLGDLVVMPNHVHLLVSLFPGTALTDQCKSWKRFSATRINRLLGRRGAFWQEESFDHLVRSSEQLDYLRRYIADNPTKAGLADGEYLLMRAEERS